MRLPMIAALALCLLAPAARTQGASWSPGFAAPERPPFPDFGDHIEAFDDGGGSRLHLAQNVLGASRVLRWSGVSWDVLFELNTPGRALQGPFRATLGGVPRLLFTYRSNVDTLVYEYDGSTWTLDGSLPYYVRYLGVLDDGSGEALYAAGFDFSTAAGHVARWNGTSWTQVGPTFASRVDGLAVFDSGGGPQLHACGESGLSPGSAVARWDGVSWSALGTLTTRTIALASYGGRLFGAGSALSMWDGSSWVVAYNAGSGINDLEVIDFGSGPVLAFSGPRWHPFYGLGFLTMPGGQPSVSIPLLTGVTRIDALSTQPLPGGAQLVCPGSMETVGGVGARGLAFFDGTNWSTIGRGFDGPVLSLAVHDDGTGPKLVAGGDMIVAGFADNSEAPHSWNGTDWSRLGSLPIVTEYVVASLDVGGGPQLFMAGQGGVVRWNGTSWGYVATRGPAEVHCLASFDPGTGPRLIAGGNFALAAGNRITQLTGGTWSPLGTGMDDQVRALSTFDEGGGPRLFAGGAFSTAGGVSTGSIARWDGSAWSALGSGTNGQVLALTTFDDGGGPQLYAGGTFTSAGGASVQFLARWNGSSWSDLPGGGANGAVLALQVHDDGRGPALFVGGGFSTIGGITAYNLARFDGSGWEAVDGGTDGAVRCLASCDDDADGDPDLFAGGDFLVTGSVASGRIARLEGRPHYQAICSGDGLLADHTTACPCANNGLTGRGCANSFHAGGAQLTASGGTNPDTLVLSAAGLAMSSFGLFMQHDAPDDRVFHDGVICAGGNLLRLRNRTTVGGACVFPDSNDTVTVSQRGQVTPGSGAIRYCAVFYRNASTTFCPPATANVTNGLRVVW